MKRPRILLADDHPVIREGLLLMLEKDFEIVAAVEDGRKAVREVERLAPDVALVDISMPLLNGVEATRQIRQKRLKTRVVILTMHSDVTIATEALEAGASGYVLKTAAAEEIRTAIRKALAGKTYVVPQVSREIVRISRSSRASGGSIRRLTVRQREVLQLLAEGKTCKEIADVLCVSPRTVEFHKYSMMEQLGLHSSAELTRYAVKHGVIAV